MRKLLLIAILLLVGCASSQPERSTANTFDTTVPARHIVDVSRDVQQWHDMEHPSCKYISVVAIKTLKSDKGSAQEDWTILACGGKKFDYAVTVIPYAGGISDSVGNIDGSPLKISNQ